MEIDDPSDITGLTIWMDANDSESFEYNQTNNTILKSWNNRIAGDDYDFDLIWGNPTRKYSNGKWTVDFDGDDMLGTTTLNTDFSYTVFSVSRQTGGQNARLISSDHNWLMGYHGGYNNKFYFNGWLHDAQENSDTNWHLHVATMNSSDEGSTWKNLLKGANKGRKASDTQPYINRLRFGGWGNGQNPAEPSEGQVSSFLFYDSELSEVERNAVEAYLIKKWNLPYNLDHERKLKIEDSDYFRK